MNDTALIVKNIEHENGGLILDIFHENGINYEIIDLSHGVRFPQISTFKLIIILGGPDSANDNTNKILKEQQFISEAFKRNTPIFGICLGMQLLVKVMGGTVYENPIQELGFKHNNKWHTVELTELGKQDPLFKNVHDTFIVFQLHGETVDLIKEIALLGIGQTCKNQIVKVGQYNYGVQFHFEVTEELLNDWIIKAPELKNSDSNQIFKDYMQIQEEYLQVGRILFENYLRLINLI